MRSRNLIGLKMLIRTHSFLFSTPLMEDDPHCKRHRLDRNAGICTLADSNTALLSWTFPVSKFERISRTQQTCNDLFSHSGYNFNMLYFYLVPFVIDFNKSLGRKFPFITPNDWKHSLRNMLSGTTRLLPHAHLYGLHQSSSLWQRFVIRSKLLAENYLSWVIMQVDEGKANLEDSNYTQHSSARLVAYFWVTEPWERYIFIGSTSNQYGSLTFNIYEFLPIAMKFARVEPYPHLTINRLRLFHVGNVKEYLFSNHFCKDEYYNQYRLLDYLQPCYFPNVVMRLIFSYVRASDILRYEFKFLSSETVEDKHRWINHPYTCMDPDGDLTDEEDMDFEDFRAWWDICSLEYEPDPVWDPEVEDYVQP